MAAPLRDLEKSNLNIGGSSLKNTSRFPEADKKSAAPPAEPCERSYRFAPQGILKRYISISGGEQKIGSASGGNLRKVISILGGDSLKRYILISGGKQKIGSSSGGNCKKSYLFRPAFA